MPLDQYIVDFYCKKLKLVIEIDGNSHHNEISQMEDHERQKVLEGFGLSFLRFSDLEVKKKMPWVLEVLNAFIDDFEFINGLEKSSFINKLNPPCPL